MAFSLGTSSPAGGRPPAELGPELPDIIAEEVGFKGVSSDSNVRLLPTPWPEDALPSPTCTLLAVAPTKGIVVGAGPNILAITSSEAVRKAISAPTGEEKVKTKPFEPQATIPLPARPTHIAFAAGESALVLATENGSELVVYETASLLTGSAQPALVIRTNGATFRALVPNPAPQDDANASFVALVTTNGELLIANLKGGNLVSGANGQVLKTGVSAACWSNKGKQLVAGLADGTGVQMTTDGTEKAVIPRPSDLEDNCHVSSIAWLENDIFLMVYTPNLAEDDMGQTPSSSYYIITRRKQEPFLIQKLSEVSAPFGYKRAPAYQFIARLKDYNPHLKDALIVSSTASGDIGLITRSDQPLASDEAAKSTAGLFTSTEVNDDTKRASLPLKESQDETSVIGLGIDLSSTENVVSPIQGEDIDESSSPLPNLLLLNNDGILSSWWFIYSESIRQKLPYHGLATATQQQQPSQPSQPQPPKQSSFGQPTFGQSGFGTPSVLPAPPTFGKPSAFGSPSTIGGTSPFGKPPALSGPTFGTPSQIGTSFGTPSVLGQAPTFGQSGFGQVSSASGQPSTPGKPLGFSPFSTPNATSAGGFGSFADKKGGFGSLATSQPSGESPFGRTAVENPFGRSAGESPFAILSGPSTFGGQTDTTTAFTPQKIDQSKGPFGLGPGGFSLGSTFKGDGSAVNDGPKPDKPSGLFSMGALDDMVSSPDKTPLTESMDDAEDQPVATQAEKPAAKEPTQQLFGAPSKIGAQVQPQLSLQTSKPPFSLFGNTATEKQVTSPLSPPSEKTTIASLTPKAENIPSAPFPETPLPPDPTSRAVYNPGDTSASSTLSKSPIEDAPLPPDFVTKPKPALMAAEEAPLPPDFTKKLPETQAKKIEAEEAPLPPEPASPESVEESDRDGSDADESEREGSEEADESDFADSGEDITHELSQEEEEVETAGQTPKISPESSFGTGLSEQSPAGGLFSRVSKPGPFQNQPPRQLFGEIPKPIFPPANVHRESPRSPSPVRSATQNALFKPQSQKLSKPQQIPGRTLAARKASLVESVLRDNQLKSQPLQTSREEQARLSLQAKQQEEALSLSDDDEDERLRADLAQPLEPVPTLDPFLPHQDYTGETTKPGIPGQIEKLYRDINSMVDTLGINARSLSSFLLYQQSSKDSERWIKPLKGDHPADILDEKVLLSEIEKLDDAVVMLAGSLQEQRVQGVEDKLESCRTLLSKDILTLRGQCASIRKTLDAYTDTAAILSAPLSAEQATLQQDLRSYSTDIQAKLADLESGVSLLRAKIADAPRPDSGMKRPTVEAVTSTIATMMNMAESKSSDIDVLEAQLKKLGVDTAAPPRSREGSPFATPKKALVRFPTTPGSHGSFDGPVTAYHTPESAAQGANFRSSINGSAKASRLRSVESVGGLATKEEIAQWKAKRQRRQHIVESLKKAIGEKTLKVRSMDDL